MRFKFKSRSARTVAVWFYAFVMVFITIGIVAWKVTGNLIKVIFYTGWGAVNGYCTSVEKLYEVNYHD